MVCVEGGGDSIFFFSITRDLFFKIYVILDENELKNAAVYQEVQAEIREPRLPEAVANIALEIMENC